MLKHSSPISGINTFVDKYVATAGYDNRVILWDAKTHLPITCAYHDHLANQCTFSPCGRYLATASSDHTARVWQLPSLKLLRVFSDHTDDIEMVAFHPTRNWLAIASRDYKINVYEIFGKKIAHLQGHTADVISIHWLKNTDVLISSSDDGTVRKWNISNEELLETIDMQDVETDTIAISDIGYIYAGNDKGQIIILRSDKTELIQTHEAGIKRLIYSTHNFLLSLSYDRSAKVWIIKSDGSLILYRTLNLPPVIWPRSAAFLNNNKLVFATFGSTYALYDLDNDQWHLSGIESTSGYNAVLSVGNNIYTIGDAGILKKNNKHIIQLPSLCNFMVSCGDSIITGGQTGAIFDAIQGKIIYQHHSPLNCAVIFREELVIVGTYTGEAIVLKKNAKEFSYSHSIKLHDNAIKGLSISEDVLFSVCATGAAAFYSIESNKIIKFFPNAHTKIANGCTVLGNMKFASVSRDLKLYIWNQYKIEIINTPHTHSIKCIAATTNQQLIATGSYNGFVHIYDCQHKQWLLGKRLTTFGISCLIYNISRNCFLASSYDGNVYEISLKNF